MWEKITNASVRARIRNLDIPFNRYGLDKFGISREHLGALYSLLDLLYHHYFTVRAVGVQNVPEGRGMLIGNHSGGLPVDAGMVIASLFFEHEPPRHCHGMVEKFAQNWPFISPLFSRIGQLAGLPEHAVRILEAERLLMVFPEGARGTGKLYKDRYKMVRFGTGFMRIAMQTKTPIIPFGFVGGEEALPTIYHAKLLAQLTGAPYWPVPPYLLPVPRPFPCDLHFGEPMYFEGDGTETDEVIEGNVEQVKQRIAMLITDGREARRRRR